MARPNFFIVGCPKCGTTSMHEYLREHPQVFMSEPVKEPCYFCRDLKIAPLGQPRSDEEYLQLFRKAGAEHRRIGESSTWYMLSAAAAKLLNDWDGQCKAIAMIRSPMEAAYSLHGQLLWSCNEDIVDFEEALAAEADRREGRRIGPECFAPDALQYTATFSYAPQLRRYFAIFGRERVKVILFDEFVKETPRVYRETLEFLGVDPTFAPKFEVVNAAKPVAMGVNRFFAKRPRLRSAVYKLVPAAIQRKAAELVPMFAKTVERAPKIDKETKMKLLPRFERDIEETGKLLGRDLSHWCRV